MGSPPTASRSRADFRNALPFMSSSRNDAKDEIRGDFPWERSADPLAIRIEEAEVGGHPCALWLDAVDGDQVRERRVFRMDLDFDIDGVEPQSARPPSDLSLLHAYRQWVIATFPWEVTTNFVFDITPRG